MFRHQGKTRTLRHNLKIASLLSFVAGLVNVAGFFSVQRLTTNVTGHFAFFVDEVFKLNLSGSIVFALYILAFFAGSFTSNLLVEIISRKNDRFVFVIPALLESMILLTIALAGSRLAIHSPDTLACALLFAMGLQNSLVTRLSGAIVRTTHLTGLFTDLGIELSQLFFYKTSEQQHQLFSTIRLRLRIISFFFIGGIAGGMLYAEMQLYGLIVASMVLIAGLVYDSIKFRIIRIKRKYQGPD
jgi:uncharacterized membrane protein YoaK (UPF0700 family)